MLKYKGELFINGNNSQTRFVLLRSGYVNICEQHSNKCCGSCIARRWCQCVAQSSAGNQRLSLVVSLQDNDRIITATENSVKDG
jgi:hypothetical protein